MTKIPCPACAARYNVPDEKLGKRVKCAKCGQHFLLTAPPAPPTGVGGPAIATTAGTAATSAAAAGDDLFPDLPLPLQPVAPAVPTAPPPAHTTASPPSRRGGSASTAPFAPTAGPAQLAVYLNDCILGFARIIAHPWELLTVVAVCFICLLKIPASFAFVGGAAVLIINGWYLSFLLKVVQAGANREDGLPDFSLADGVWEDVVLPCLSFVVVRLISLIPLIAVLIYAVQESRLDSVVAFGIGIVAVATPELALVMAFLLNSEFPNLALIAVPPLLLGLAAVPMLLLVVAIAGIDSLTRVDLMATTIVRTLPGYLAATLMYLASLGVAAGAGFAVEQMVSEQTRPAAAAAPAPPIAAPAAPPAVTSDPNSAADPNSVLATAPPGSGAAMRQPRDPDDIAARFAGSLLAKAVTIVIGVFASVFAMRAIGLYYAHFKRRFAWSWG